MTVLAWVGQRAKPEAGATWMRAFLCNGYKRMGNPDRCSILQDHVVVWRLALANIQSRPVVHWCGTGADRDNRLPDAVHSWLRVQGRHFHRIATVYGGGCCCFSDG